jgi:hypothetical protein
LPLTPSFIFSSNIEDVIQATEEKAPTKEFGKRPSETDSSEMLPGWHRRRHKVERSLGDPPGLEVYRTIKKIHRQRRAVGVLSSHLNRELFSQRTWKPPILK